MIKSELQSTADGKWLASFTYSHGCSADQVWQVLTDETFVNEWHPQLRMYNLRDDGNLIFDFGDEQIHELPIREFVDGKVLGFEWYGSYVRFGVAEEGELLMTFKVNEVNEQSLRDLTGWTMVSKAIDASLHGDNFTFDKELAGKIRQEYEGKLGL